MERVQPLITVLPQARAKDDLGSLGGAFQRDVEAVAYTCFGDLFLRDVETSQIALAYICPFELISLDASSIEEALAILEANPQAKDEFLNPAKVDALVERLGPLADGEIYVPYPIPMLGGDGSLGSYGKGRIWAHVEFVTA